MTANRPAEAMSSFLFVELLGAALVADKLSEVRTLREQVRSGLPVAALNSLMACLQLSRDELSHVLSVPQRTLTRRRQEERLTAVESDRLVRLARVAHHAIDVLGTTTKATHWLRTPNRALGGEIPMTLLDTEIGSRQVEEVLGRLEQGVYS